MSWQSQIPTLADLSRHISREESVCCSLLETVQDERAAIRQLAISEFHSINSKRLAILESLQTLALDGSELVRRLAVGYGWSEATTLQGLMDSLPESESVGLRAQHRSFMSIAKSVREEIAQNVVLIKGIRELIDQALAVGNSIVPGQDVYGSNGRRPQALCANVLVHQQG